MRIMFVIVSMNRGGAENVASVLSNEFVRIGHEVFFVSDKSESEITEYYPLVESVCIEKCFQRKGIVKKILDLRKVIKKYSPDVVLGITPNPSFIAFVASLGTKTHVISTDHDSFERPYKFSLKEYVLKFIVNKIYKCVTVITDADKKVIGNRVKRIEVMPNPLSLEPIKKEIGNRQKKILAVGRLDAWHCKGFDLLINAWSKISEKYPDWTIEIAGEGDAGKLYLMNLIKDNNLENSVVLSGFHYDMNRVYQESEIFVLSSRYEGFGMVLIEAMSQGCACIACDYKGRQSEIIEDESQGLCIEPDNVDLLANAIEKMIADETYRRIVQKNSVERSKFYAADKIARKWVKLLQEFV